MVDSNNAINNTVGASISGVTNTFTVTNPSNTASSEAKGLITVGGASAGDPFLNFNVSGATDWSIGIDNDASDMWKLSNASSLGSSDSITVDTTGRVLKPLQPSFLAYLNTTLTNVTGDTTSYQIIYDTEAFDIGSNFNVATGVFTAPVSGIYSFQSVCTFGGLVAAHNSGRINYLINGATKYQGASGNPFAQAGFGLMGWTHPLIIQLTASDTVACTAEVDNGAKVVDLAGAASFGGIRSTYFCGYLLG